MIRQITGLSLAVLITGCATSTPNSFDVAARGPLVDRAILEGQCAGTFQSISQNLEQAGDSRAQYTSAYASELSDLAKANFDQLFEQDDFADKLHGSNLVIGMQKVDGRLRNGDALDEVLYVKGVECEKDTGLAVWDFGLERPAGA